MLNNDFLLGYGAGKANGGAAAILIDKTINANGEYNASDDDADGYKSVLVSVPAELPSYVTHHQYTVAEDAITSSTGQTLNFVDNYCLDGKGVYWAAVSNNDGGLTDPTIYRGKCCTISLAPNGTNFDLTQKTGTFVRYANAQGGVDTQKSFYLYAGAVIDIYYVPYNFVEVMR